MNNTTTSFETICDILEYHASKSPQTTAFEFIDSIAGDSEINYKDLYENSLALALKIRKTCAPQDRVLLLFPAGIDFVIAFLACCIARVIAVPCYYPMSSKITHWTRIKHIIDNCEPELILCNEKTSNSVLGGLANIDVKKIEVLSMGELIISFGQDEKIEDRPTRKDLMLLQYSSGSTMKPKGVLVSHGNNMHNQTVIKKGFGFDSTTSSISWAPHFHDMGLIAGILQPIYLGITCTLMSPHNFIASPIRWLELISRKKLTAGGGSNYGFQLCVDRISSEDISNSNLDLSSWTTAYVSAEPVQKNTLNKFLDKFRVCGFKESSFSPSYGLAEATLLVTCGKPKSSPRFVELSNNEITNNRILDGTRYVDLGEETRQGAIVVASSGSICIGQEVKIVDKDTNVECNEGGIGEIWVSSPSVANAYWRLCKLSAETLRAEISPREVTGKTFLRTGDMGFVLDQELYVVGRYKDVMNIGGVNMYPTDIEFFIQDIEGFVRHGGVAFSIDSNGAEKVVLVQEIKRNMMRSDLTVLYKRTIEKIFEVFQFSLHELIFVKPASVPRTTSGKIQRNIARDMYLKGEWADRKIKNVMR